jgi:hypothetical protein
MSSFSKYSLPYCCILYVAGELNLASSSSIMLIDDDEVPALREFSDGIR